MGIGRRNIQYRPFGAAAVKKTIHRHDWPPLARSRIAIGPHRLAVGEFPTNSRSAPTAPFSRVDFAYDQESDAYVCPAGKQLRKYRRPFVTPRIGAAPSSMKSTPAAIRLSWLRTSTSWRAPHAPSLVFWFLGSRCLIRGCLIRGRGGIRPGTGLASTWVMKLHTRCIRPPVTPPSAGRA